MNSNITHLIFEFQYYSFDFWIPILLIWFLNSNITHLIFELQYCSYDFFMVVKTNKKHVRVVKHKHLSMIILNFAPPSIPIYI